MEAASTSSANLLVKIAAISVTAVSLAGVGVLTGLLPMPGQGNHTETSSAVPAATQSGTPATPAATSATAGGPASSSPATVTSPETAATPVPPVAAPTPAPARKTHVATRPPVRSAAANSERSAPPESQGAYSEPPRPAPAAAICRECGVIESVQEVDQKGEGTGLGAIAGGVLGGLLGSQIGAGHGKDVAAVAGAVGGAYAGHQVEKNVRSTKQYQVTVRLEDGSSRMFTESTMPTWRIGERVRVESGAIVPR